MDRFEEVSPSRDNRVSRAPEKTFLFNHKADGDEMDQQKQYCDLEISSPTPSSRSCYLKNPFKLNLKIGSQSPYGDENMQDESEEDDESVDYEDEIEVSSQFSCTNQIFD